MAGLRLGSGAASADARAFAKPPIKPRGAKPDHQNQHARRRAIEIKPRRVAGQRACAPSPSALTTNAPSSGPNTVPTPPMIGVSSASIEIQVP